MKLALRLAQRTEYTSPNPMVGAILVKNNRIIGQAIIAIVVQNTRKLTPSEMREQLCRSNSLCNAGPCCHHGQTPCTEIIIKNKIARVVVGSIDTNPLVSCRGITPAGKRH